MRAFARRGSRRAGLTLVELIVAFSILLILSTMALPLTQIKVQREKERRLRDALDEMRTAIDRYKDAADAGLLGDIDPENHGYPEDLDVLVEGVEIQAGGGGLGGPAAGAGSANGIGGVTGSFSGPRREGATSGPRRQGATSGLAGGLGGGRSGGLGGASNRSRSDSRGQRGTAASLGSDEEEQKVRFLRRIPVDPMTGRAEWGKRSVTDSPDSMSWGGRNVFDVYSLSAETGLDGTPYNQW